MAFSEKPEGEQVACIEFLDAEFKSAVAKLGLKRKDGVYVNCTGDGFLAAVPTDCGGGLAHEHSLDLCSEIVKACASYRGRADTPSHLRKLGVRFGIHEDVYRANVKAFNGVHLIGRGLNHAARVAQVGDEASVVVSEEFLRAGDTPDWKAKFSEPIEISVKHNRLAVVHIYKGGGNPAFNSQKPRRVLLAEEVGSRINSQLQAMVQALEKDIGALVGGREHLRCRVSVFLPDPSGMLSSTYRYHWARGWEARGATRYSIDPAVGAIGHAFARGERQLVVGLPDPSKDPEAYLQAWLSHPYDLTKQHINGWSRMPRSVMALPFETGSRPFDVRGVLCVDAHDPLDSVDKSLIEGVMRGLEERANQRLAWDLLTRRLV